MVSDRLARLDVLAPETELPRTTRQVVGVTTALGGGASLEPGLEHPGGSFRAKMPETPKRPGKVLYTPNSRGQHFEGPTDFFVYSIAARVGQVDMRQRVAADFVSGRHERFDLVPAHRRLDTVANFGAEHATHVAGTAVPNQLGADKKSRGCAKLVEDLGGTQATKETIVKTKGGVRSVDLSHGDPAHRV